MASNRSANTYQKIDTIFKRDANNIIMQYDSFVDPALEYLRQYGVKFDASEKVDGTNTRLEVSKRILYANPQNDKLPYGVEFEVAYKGKSDDAQMPKHLDAFLRETYTEDKVLNALGLKKVILVDEFAEHKWVELDKNGNVVGPDFNKIPNLYTIYGEGYGVKIQKGGNYIPDGVGFIVFDVKVGDTYLLRENMYAVAEKLGAPHVPYMGQFTIDEAIDFVRTGFKSTIAANKDYDAEGLVLTTPIGLKNRRGERIIFKIKTCDFIKYRAKYGTDGPVEQPVNEKYSRE